MSMMSFLDNGLIRLGVDLARGGAVTFLADCRDGVNRINNWDWGRQVQMSFYSGPVPFQPPGTTLAECWQGLGWNPIQSGDHFRHGSRVLEHTHDGTTIHVRSVPMIWPLDNVPAECVFVSTYRLDGKAVLVTCRLENARSDHTQYAGRGQELRFRPLPVSESNNNHDLQNLRSDVFILFRSGARFGACAA